MDKSSNNSIEKYLVIIIGATFLLRFIGIWYGLPSLYNSDEPFNLLNALSFGAKKSLEPTYFVYPAFYSYCLFAVLGIYYVAGTVFGIFESALDFGAAYFLNPTGLLLTGRFFSVLLGVVTVWLLFKIGQRIYSKKIGLYAAAILALSFTHVDLSHWVLLEPAVALLTALSLYLIFRFYEKPSVKMCLLASVVSGLAISTKYNAGFIFLPLIISIVLVYKKQVSKVFLHLCLSFSALLFGFLAGSPYWLFSFPKYWSTFKFTMSHVSSGMVGHISAMPVVWPLWEIIYQDWSVGLLFLAGSIYALFQRDKKQILLLSFVLSTLLIVGFWQRTGIHYLLPIFPAFAILAAFFLHDVSEQMPRKSYRIVLLGLIFVAPLIKIVYQDIRLTQKDSRTRAKEWIESEIPGEGVIGYENYVYGPNLFDPARYFKNSTESGLLPLELKERLLREKRLRTSYVLVNLRKDFKLRNFNQVNQDTTNLENNAYIRQLLQMRLPKLATIKKAGLQYLIASSDNYDRYFKSTVPKEGTTLWFSYQNGKKFYTSVLNSEDLILLQEFKSGLWNLGPAIKIYKFKS